MPLKYKMWQEELVFVVNVKRANNFGKRKKYKMWQEVSVCVGMR